MAISRNFVGLKANLKSPTDILTLDCDALDKSDIGAFGFTEKPK